ncbi:hypothetical protein TMEN_7492 [Trichophyton mentagrophytes]|nr:hypothetical protein TMEN_7492 [Trichophyton mentagrophytes]
MRNELENLERFRGVSNIVQVARIAVDIDPYKTSPTGEQVVIGTLLQFYSGGSLQRALDDGSISGYHWEKWALQIGTALRLFHAAGRTHMDIKSSNIVLDGKGNAILIDISGIGGTTHEWRAPEIRDEISPLDLPFEVRRLNDVWACGKLLSEIASHAGSSPHATILEQVARCLMRDDTMTRIGLSEAMSRLEAVRTRTRLNVILVEPTIGSGTFGASLAGIWFLVTSDDPALRRSARRGIFCGYPFTYFFAALRIAARVFETLVIVAAIMDPYSEAAHSEEIVLYNMKGKVLNFCVVWVSKKHKTASFRL